MQDSKDFVFRENLGSVILSATKYLKYRFKEFTYHKFFESFYNQGKIHRNDEITYLFL